MTPWVLALVPEIGLILLLIAVLIYDRSLPSGERRRVGLLTAWGAFAILSATLGVWFILGEPQANSTLSNSLFWGDMIRNDLVTLVFRVMFLVALMITSLISLDVERLQKGEYYSLLITATIGFSLMAASSDLIMVYVALETASISSYILAGFLTKDNRSAEAGMKYFVYGAFATGVMLYGMSLVYGLTGQTSYYGIASFLAGAGTPPAEAQAVLLLASVMILVGFGFKISAVPFHFWTPDVYEGAPTPFTAFVSTASKAAGFAILLRLFTSGVLGAASTSSGWWAMLVAISIVTMTLGNFVAIFQQNLKRMLAYSSIAQAGYVLIGLIALTPDGASATMYYLLMYVFTNIAAFGGIVLVSNVTGSEKLEDFNGLSRRSPYLALVMMLALLSLGGIPPTAGFVGKFFLFKAAVDAGLWWLALIGILNAFVALYYYLSVLKYMYLYRSEQEDVAIPISRGTQVGMAFSALFIIILGVVPQFAFEWTRQAALAFFSG
ncbi:MAG: NADH-quinone oxidoreductase subunit N [Anaerolineales bacterium]|nr:NADH-quinone oxidoreductase subunit N [Anaerolineales bacterium]MCB8992120.1 NADH-quinone oxidoreductase subunit N [Ardenticatenaceae bacterium]